MSATQNEIKEQVRAALDGDPAGNFDVLAITRDLINRFGPLDSIDEIPRDALWAAVAKHDLTI